MNDKLTEEQVYALAKRRVEARRDFVIHLIVYLGDLDWRSVGSVGYGGRIHVFENDTGPDDANHAQEGVFAWYNRGEKKTGAGYRAEEAAASGETLPASAGKYSIYDIAPSILDFFSIEVPDDMIGKVL